MLRSTILSICSRQVFKYRFFIYTCIVLVLFCLFLLRGVYNSLSTTYDVVGLQAPGLHLNQRAAMLTSPPKCEISKGQQVILLTYGRSGSSLTADIIQRQSQVFLYFEPLHDLAKRFEQRQVDYMLDYNKHLHLTTITEYNRQALSIVEKLMTCRYKRLPKVAASNVHLRLYESTSEMFWCARVAITKKTMARCLKAGEEKCRGKSIQFLKIIRLSTYSVGQLMDKYPCLKMIYLVRDPRGTLLSKRKAFIVMTSNATYEAERFCYRVNKDINNAIQLQNQYPDRVHITRYESIAEKPLETSKKLYEFLGLNFTDTIAEYVYNITLSGRGNNQDIYALSRVNSTEACYAWRSFIKYQDVLAIDNQCREVYYKLGYLPVNTEEKLRDMRHSLKFDKKYLS